MNKHLQLVWLACTALSLSGCFGATTAEQRYYTMSLPVISQPAQSRNKAEVWVREVEISPVYNRPQIVYRFSPQELQFFHQNNWADRPSRMLGQLLAQSVTSSGLFRSVVQRMGAEAPTYVLDSSVQAIEELQGGAVWYAHLAMTFRLARFEDNKAIWQYTFDERRPLNQQELGLVVRAMSEILDEQMHIALAQMDAVLSDRALPAPTQAAHVAPKPAQPAEQAAQEPCPPEDEVEFDGTNGEHVNWRKSAQYHSDATQVPAGQGAIFLPSLSLKPDREPPVQVARAGRRIATGTMGHRIVVPAGHYEITFGSGSVPQHVVRQVDVTEGETTIVAPTWATLDISVVTAKFIPFLGNYEIIRMEDREYMGIGYGVDEELGQETQVWVLRPGLYKIIQSGSTYRARTNFATVLLVEGMAVPYTLVQDEVSRDFLGAGVAEMDRDHTNDGPWQLRSSLGGSVLLTNRTEGYSSAPVGSGLGIDVYADNRLRFAQDAHLWTTRLEIEEGQTLSPTIGADHKPGNLLDGRLQSVKDRVYLNSIYIYQALPWIGPYVRLGGETTLFDQATYFSTPTSVVVQDASGKNLSGTERSNVTRLTLAGPLTPIQLKQGLGINFRVAHSALLDLNLRAGLGSRQYIARGQLVAADDASTPAYEVREVPGTVLTGTEASWLAQARLTRYLQASSELDALFPFNGLELTQMAWRNAVSLRLGSFAALTYTFNLVRQPNVNPDQPFAYEQGLQLRFYYSPF